MYIYLQSVYVCVCAHLCAEWLMEAVTNRLHPLLSDDAREAVCVCVMLFHLLLVVALKNMKRETTTSWLVRWHKNQHESS